MNTNYCSVHIAKPFRYDRCRSMGLVNETLNQLITFQLNCKQTYYFSGSN